MSLTENNIVNNETFTIYQGTWINWEEGAVFGAQATLSARNAQILSSFLSIFVTFVGVQLWQIISFVVHQLRSTDGPSDGLHYQIQVVLRNASSPWSAANAFLNVLWSWRRHADHFFSRSIPWAILAGNYALGFGIISIFAASEVTKAPGNSRIAIGRYCGFYETNATDIFSNDFWQQGEVTNANNAAQYAESCYPGNTTTSVIQCNIFRKPYINFARSHTSSCPFGNSICNMNNTLPLVMDTGMIDTAHDLGINTPDNQRLQYRKQTTCTPLNSTGHTTLHNITSDNNPFPAVPGDRVVTYNFGPIVNTPVNYTFSYNTHGVIDQIGYTVNSNYAYAHSGMDGLGFEPIPALNRTDADIMLVSIAGNDIQFEEPCDDPIFAAHIEEDLPASDNLPAFSFWNSDHFVQTIACAEQHQICNPNNKMCTDLVGYWDASQQVFQRLKLNNMQAMVAMRISTTMQRSNLYSTTNGRSAGALQAQNSVSQLSQAPLPPNQWEIESASWFSAGLARLQQEVQQYATRSSDANITLDAANDVNRRMAQWQCSHQLTLSTQGTVSYSLLGLGLILCVGVAVIMISYLLEPITSLAQRRIFKRGLHKHRDWVLNEKLQLHRMALEGRGVGPWFSTDRSVPVTERGRLFAGWQESDIEGDYRTEARGPRVQRVDDEVTEAPEGKPFIAQHDSEDTAYHGRNGPRLHVEEY